MPENARNYTCSIDGTVIAITRTTFMVLKKLPRLLVTLAVPASIAFAAFLHANAIGALIDATATASPMSDQPISTSKLATEARAGTSSASMAKSANAILDRNAFDHATGPLRHSDEEVASASGGDDDDVVTSFSDVLKAPACDGVRATVTMHAQDAEASFAAFDVRGKRVLQKRGGDVDNLRVVYVGEDRVWLTTQSGQRGQLGKLCQARVFGSAGLTTTGTGTGTGDQQPQQKPGQEQQPGKQSAFEQEVSKKIVKTGPNEYQVDRGAVNMILEAQTELMKTPLIPEKEGDRVVGFRLVKIKQGSVLGTLGLESGDRLVALNGIEVTSTERMIEAYAKLKSGTIDRFTINIVRGGKPTNLDYVVR